MEVHALTLNSSNFHHTGYPGDRLFSVDTTMLSVAIPGCRAFVMMILRPIYALALNHHPIEGRPIAWQVKPCFNAVSCGQIFLPSTKTLCSMQLASLS